MLASLLYIYQWILWLITSYTLAYGASKVDIAACIGGNGMIFSELPKQKSLNGYPTANVSVSNVVNGQMRGNLPIYKNVNG